MPRLSPWQWLLVAAFLIFYGFAVFALTRDYYLRHPGPVAAAVPSGGPATWLQGQMQGPAPDLQAALAGTDPGPLGQLADDLFIQERYAEAVPLYRRILELTPDDVEIHNDLGLALHYTGETAAAIEVLQQGADMDAQHQRIWLTLGFVRAADGEIAAARRALEYARSLGPATPVGQEAGRLLGTLAQE